MSDSIPSGIIDAMFDEILRIGKQVDKIKSDQELLIAQTQANFDLQNSSIHQLTRLIRSNQDRISDVERKLDLDSVKNNVVRL